jgi:hypothetical protein
MQDAVVNLIRVSLRDHQRTGNPVSAPATSWASARRARRIAATPAARTTTCFCSCRSSSVRSEDDRPDRPFGDARYETAAVAAQSEVDALVEDWTPSAPSTTS